MQLLLILYVLSVGARNQWWGTKTAVEMKFYDEVNIYVCMYVCTHGQDREIDDKMIEFVNKNVVKKKDETQFKRSNVKTTENKQHNCTK